MASQRESLLCRYHYDPLDRMISHARPAEPDRQRFYCQSKLATEIQGAMQHSIFQKVDQLLAQQKREGNSIDVTLLAIDQQRSVLHTLDGKNHRQPIAYSPYGHRPTESGLTSLLGFNGEWLDPVTGHYLLGSYRAFNPLLMRFNSPDNLSPFGRGGVNGYAYCSGDSVNRSDPSGHMPNASKLLLKRSPSPSRKAANAASASEPYRVGDSASSRISRADIQETISAQDDFSQVKKEPRADFAEDKMYVRELYKARENDFIYKSAMPDYDSPELKFYEYIKITAGDRAFDRGKYYAVLRGKADSAYRESQDEAVRFSKKVDKAFSEYREAAEHIRKWPYKQN